MSYSICFCFVPIWPHLAICIPLFPFWLKHFTSRFSLLYRLFSYFPWEFNCSTVRLHLRIGSTSISLMCISFHVLVNNDPKWKQWYRHKEWVYNGCINSLYRERAIKFFERVSNPNCFNKKIKKSSKNSITGILCIWFCMRKCWYCIKKKINNFVNCNMHDICVYAHTCRILVLFLIF